MTHQNFKKGSDNLTNTNLLKSKMAVVGDTDFVKCLADVLDISRTTASKKLNGDKPFDQKEITILVIKYRISDSEIRDIFVGAE